MKYLTSAAISAVSVFSIALVAGSASAANITAVLGGSTVTGLSEFNDTTAPNYSFDVANTLSASPNIRIGSVTNVNAAPLSDGSNYMVVQPTGVGNVGTLTTGPVYFTSASLLDTFSIYWGSADASNQVDFYNGATLVESFTGLSVFGNLGSVFGSWTNASANRLVTFNSALGQEFDQVKFSTGSIAFEFDSVRPVPVPAIVPGIALAAAFFGSKALKRNKKNANESVA